ELGATPAREAALELVARGLLVHESHRGVRVADVDPERASHVYSVRALLEAEAARLAAHDADDVAVERLRRARPAIANGSPSPTNDFIGCSPMARAIPCSRGRSSNCGSSFRATCFGAIA